MGIPRYVRLLLRPPALNIDEAAWEMIHTITAPRKMYRSLNYRHQTRNKWAREDPSFIIFLFILLCISALFWGLTYAPTWSGIIKLFWWMVFIDFIGVGLLLSTASYMVINKYGQKSGPHEPLEWAFCFDVHCNAFVCVYLWLYLVQYLLSSLVLHQPYWIALIIGNLLYFIALAHYFFITFLGYSALPFVKYTQVLLIPIAISFIVCFVCTLTKFNIPQYIGQGYLNWKST